MNGVEGWLRGPRGTRVWESEEGPGPQKHRCAHQPPRVKGLPPGDERRLYSILVIFVLNDSYSGLHPWRVSELVEVTLP